MSDHRLALPFLALVTWLAAAPAPAADLPCAGRWDATVTIGHSSAPAWFEVTGSAAAPAVRFQPPAGAPEQVHTVTYQDGRLSFFTAALGPVQGTFDGDRFVGSADSRGVDSVRVTAVRARPPADGSASWGKPQRLFDGRTLDGWKLRWNKDGSWAVSRGALMSAQQSDDLVTVGRYLNFKLHLQYRLQEYQDSGVQLRGRYEIQLSGRADPAGPSGHAGALYGYLPPLVEAQRPAGQWNTLDVELVGSELTVTLNGKRVQDHVQLVGITGDALDSDESQPGPIMLQGHLGLVEFRDIVITPAS